MSRPKRIKPAAGKSDDVSRLKRLEHRLDRQFSLFGFRVGLDGIIGLVPVAGDLITACLGLYLVLEARRLGARPLTVARMLGNLAIDLGLGAFPVAGDLADFAFRANTRNIRLLIADLEQRASELRELNREQHLRAA